MKLLPDFPIKIVETVASQYNKAFHAKLFTLFASSESELVQLSKDFPLHYDYCFCFLKDEQGQWFLDEKGIQRIRNYIIKLSKKDSKYIFKYYNKWQKNWDKYLLLNKKLINLDFSKYSDKQLYREFKKYYNLYLKTGGVAYICDSFMASGEKDWLQELLSEELKNNYSNNFKDVISELVSPVHLSFVLKEEFNLLKIAVELNKMGQADLPEFDSLPENIKQSLYEHEQNFYWIKNNYYNVEYYSAIEAYERAKILLGDYKNQGLDVEEVLRKKELELKHNQQKREDVINSVRLSQSNKNIVRVANLFSKWKDTRKSGVYMGMAMFDKFLAEIAERINCSKQDLTFTIFAEIKDILLKKINYKSVIEKRKSKSFFVVTNKVFLLLDSDSSKKYFDCWEKDKIDKKIEMKGVVACKLGKVTGMVRIVRNKDDMDKFQEGEILVTNNTTPEFVPIMKKASAIITEQGGITSHAAIVSRELNKPCIIGIKNATILLQDKNKVLVNTNNGIIKIIN